MAASRQWNADVVNAAAASLLGVSVDADLVVVDTRPLFNLHDESLRLRFGTHPKTFAAIAAHPALPAVLSEPALALVAALSEASMNASGSRPPTVRFVMVCLSGRHRSVAVARIAAEVVLRCPDARLAEVQDLTPPSRTASHCRDCDACSFFNRRWPQREAALEQAVGVWNALWELGP